MNCMLKDSQRILLKLIEKSQFETVDEIEDFAVGDIDWGAIYDEAFSQSVVGIVAPEIPGVVYSSDERWSKIQSQLLAISIRYYHAQTELTKLLEKHDIPFVILKGASAAVYYKHPKRRMMGDIDFLVSKDKFEETRQLLVENGYHVADDKVFDPLVARHIGFHKNKILYELHHHYSHKDIDIENYLSEGMGNKVYASIDSHEFPMLPRLSNGLVLLDHMKTHFQSGLGLRQVIDWMMYVYRELTDEYWQNEFAPAVRSIGLEKFAISATRMCQIYLGLPESITWCRGADEEVCSRLIEMIFVSGNFGRKNGSGNTIEKVMTNIKRHGLFRWLQTAGEYNWETYKKHPSLKPLCWLYQIFRYAKKGFGTERNVGQLSEDLDRSKRRYRLLEDMGLLENDNPNR